MRSTAMKVAALALGAALLCASCVPEVEGDEDAAVKDAGESDKATEGDAAQDAALLVDAAVAADAPLLDDATGADDAAGARDAQPPRLDAAGADNPLPPLPDAGLDAMFVTNIVHPIPDTECTLRAINGGPPIGGVQPMDDVEIELRPMWTDGALPQALAYDLARAPAGSRNYLMLSGDAETPVLRLLHTYQSVSTPGPSYYTDPLPGPDLLGTYVIATWNELAPEQGFEDCYLRAGTPHGLYLELVWDRPGSDLDLQLATPNADGDYCANVPLDVAPESLQGLAVPCDDQVTNTSTCFFSNCREGPDRPDFDGDQVRGSRGDPLMLWDEMRGFGPESILVEAPAPGDYLVGTIFWYRHDLPAAVPVRATVRVHVKGWLRAQMHLELSDKQWGEAALVHWPEPGEDLCIQDLSDGGERCFPLQTLGCGSDADCGPGTRCDPELSECLPDDPPCLSEEPCDERQVCHQATDVCAEPGCWPGLACGAEGEGFCSWLTMMCLEVPIVCEEEDEPNNHILAATPIVGQRYDGTMCPGDVDVIEVPGRAGTRLEVQVTANHPEGRLSLELLDAAGSLLGSAYAYGDEPERMVHQVQRDGLFFVEITDRSSLREQYGYILSTAELAPLACFDEPGEPNDAPEQAGNSVIEPGIHMRSICGDGDRDFHTFSVPARARAGISVAVSGQESVFLRYYDATTLEPFYAGCSSIEDCILVNESDSAAHYIVEVDTWVEGDTEVPYTILLYLLEMPSCEDPFEPNDTFAQAAPVGPGVHQAGICEPADKDSYLIWLPGGGAVEGIVSWSEEGRSLQATLALSSGVPLVRSDGYSGMARVTAAGLPAGLYVISVEVLNPDVLDGAQPYTLYLSGDLSAPPWQLDAGVPDAQTTDSPTFDAGQPDAWQEDALASDAGLPDLAGEDIE